MKKEDGFIAKLAHVEWVSFDVFDTVIARCVDRPEDVFALIEAESAGVAPSGFVEIRKKAERLSRDAAWGRDASPEITLDAIYAKLAELTGLDETSIEVLRCLELEIEARVCVANPSVLPLYREAVSCGKRIAFTSDIYLPGNFIERLLKTAGYTWEILCVSSEVNRTKSHQGGLFKYLLGRLGVPASMVLHVGDNPNADIENARKIGLKTFFVPKNRDLYVAHLHSDLRSSHAGGYAALRNGLSFRLAAELDTVRSLSDAEKFWYWMGYAVAGPVIHGFASRVARAQAEGSFDKIHFLARDGFPVFNAYLSLTGKCPCLGMPDSSWFDKPLDELSGSKKELREALAVPPRSDRESYLWASRRALNFAAIGKIDERAINFLQSGPPGMPVRSFFDRIDFPIADYPEVLRHVGFETIESPVSSAEDYVKLRRLFSALELQLLRRSEDERRAYIKYLGQLGYPGPEKVLLVDIGWHGSLQKSFADLLRNGFPGCPTPLIHGLYFGTFEAAAQVHSADTPVLSYILDKGAPTENFKLLKQCIELVEILFLNSQPSFNRVVEDGDGLRFEHADMEMPFVDSFHGDLLTLGRLRYVRDANRIAPGLNPSTEDVVGVMEESLSAPSPGALREYSRLRFSDGFGSSKSRPLLPDSPGVLRWREAERVYRSAHWKVAYLSKLSPIERGLIHILCPSSKLIWRNRLAFRAS